MSTILIAGGSGLVGKRLHKLLTAIGHSVRLLTRHASGPGQFAWDPAAGSIDDKALEGVDVLINLAGAGIAEKRWTEERKKLIIDSRVQSNLVLHDALVRTGLRPRVYLSASAIGYYGDSGEALMEESSLPADRSFMVQCCEAWEKAADTIAELGIRTVKFRIGVVMAKEGGALKEFITPLRFGLGTYFGNGSAWYSWIHLDDLCRMFMWAIGEEEVEGVYNAVSPQPARIKALIQSTATAMKHWAIFMPVPAFALHTLLGEMSAVVLNSNRVSNEKILDTGFEFEFPDLDLALKQIMAG